MEEKHCKWYNDEFCTNGDSPCVADYCPVVEYPELCKCRELDKDINVRSKDDEEIVKGLENWILRDCTAKQEDLLNALDLIYRLNAEIERLAREVDKQKNFVVAGEERWKIAKEKNAEQQRYIEYLQRKLKQANVTYRSKL